MFSAHTLRPPDFAIRVIHTKIRTIQCETPYLLSPCFPRRIAFCSGVIAAFFQWVLMNTKYTFTAKTLHWGMALGLTGTFALGFYMADLPLSPAKLQFYSWHKWAGVTLLAIVVLRLVWRMLHTPPALPTTMPSWQHKASDFSHIALYVLMLTVPISGWLMSSAEGFPVVWFGVVPLPDLVPKDKALAESLKLAHKILNYSMLALVCLHIAAALKHQLIDKDGVLGRMWFGRN